MTGHTSKGLKQALRSIELEEPPGAIERTTAAAITQAAASPPRRRRLSPRSSLIGMATLICTGLMIGTAPGQAVGEWATGLFSEDLPTAPALPQAEEDARESALEAGSFEDGNHVPAQAIPAQLLAECKAVLASHPEDLGCLALIAKDDGELKPGVYSDSELRQALGIEP